jgi:hypothetical protein
MLNLYGGMSNFRSAGRRKRASSSSDGGASRSGNRAGKVDVYMSVPDLRLFLKVSVFCMQHQVILDAERLYTAPSHSWYIYSYIYSASSSSDGGASRSGNRAGKVECICPCPTSDCFSR